MTTPEVTTLHTNGQQDIMHVLPPLETSGAPVNFGEIMSLAISSLIANKVRSLLTMLGVIIGVASVVALLAIGTGASSAITGSITSSGTNIVTVQPGSPSTRGPGESGAAQTLTLADADAIADLNLPVVGVAPQFNSTTQLVAANADTSASVVGTTANYPEVNNLELASGVFFSAGQERAAERVVVLGANVAQDLFGSGQAVGQTVRIKGQPFRVIGVFKAQGGGGFGSADDRVVVPIIVTQRQLFNGRTPDGSGYLVSSIQVAAIDSEDVDMIQSRISTLLRDRHDLDADGGEDDFRFFDQAQLLETLTTVTTLFTLFLAAVAGISLVVGGIGIMNIMLVSVTERTREIGLRKAVGARGRDIMLQFVAEAVVVSLGGGLIGLIIGAALALIVTWTGVLTATVSFSAVLLALGFSLAVGLFFGIYPAQRAAKLNPIEALRHE